MSEDLSSRTAEGTVAAQFSNPEISWDEWLSRWKKTFDSVLQDLDNIKSESDRAKMREAFSQTGVEAAVRHQSLLEQIQKALEKKNALKESGIEVL